MNDLEIKKKIYDDLSDTAKNLICDFCRYLDISQIDARNLILKNTTSLAFLNCEGQLKILGSKKSLELLMKSTIFRVSEYDKPISESEINKVSKFYNITITRVSEEHPPEVLA